MADLLEIGLDASAAKRGADEFDRATNKVSASASNAGRDLDKLQRKMEQVGRTSIKDSNFTSGIKNLDREIAQKVREIDRQLDALDKGSRKGAAGLDEFDKSSRRASGGAGQLIGQIAQGDIGGTLGEIAQQSGAAGVAIIGLGLAFIGTVAAVGAMTKAIIENVREVDKLAKDSKLSATQIQGLQVVANLTGESVEDLAENYKKLGPEVKRFEDLVKSSGAAIDEDLRAKTQAASLAWEEFKLVSTGALYEIGGELLPVVASLLREVTGEIGNADSAISSFAKDARDGILQFISDIEEAVSAIGLLISGLQKIDNYDFSGGFSDIGAAIKGDREGARLRRFGRTYGVEFTQGGIDFDPSNDFGDTSSFPNTPSLKRGGGNKRRGGSNAAAQEAAALFRAQIELEKTNSRILLDVEKRRIDEAQDLIQADYENRLMLAKDYFAEKINLQQQEVTAEIRYQEALREAVLKQQARAKKPSEKAGFNNEIADIEAAIQKLSDEGARATNKLGREAAKQLDEDAKKARDTFKEFAATVRELELTYRELSEGSLSTTTERFRDQYKAVYDLMSLVTPAQRKELQNLLDLLQNKQQTRNDFNRAGIRFDNLNEQLALDEDKIRIAVEQRQISEARGMDLLKQTRAEYRDGLLEELDIMIALASAQPDSEKEVARLQRQRLEIEQFGKELSALEKRIQDFGQAAKDILQDAFYQGIVEGPRAFFQTLLGGFSRLLAQLASELLTSAFVRLLGQVFGGALGSLGGGGNSIGGSAASSGGGGGFLGILGKIVGIAGTFAGSFGGAGAGPFNAAGTGAAGGVGYGGVAGLLGGFASGGPINQSGVYDVGELGRERVYLPRGAYVENNHQMRQSSQPFVAPVNITVYAQDARSFASPQTQDQIARAHSQAAARANRNAGYSLS